MRGHTKIFGGDIRISFLLENDNKLLEKYNKIWDEVGNGM